MKVLITGAAGQLGRSLLKTARSGHRLRALTRTELNITDKQAVMATVQEFAPQVIINAAAYTAVDKAETEHAMAFAVNAEGAETLAEAARNCGARLIHVSTDFVFDGLKSRPYLPSDAKHPVGIYAASKAGGEERVQRLLGDRAIIVRTGWIYAVEGHNFVKTILRLLREKDGFNVIADQVGTPTWAMSLAELIWVMTGRPELGGLFHWSDSGVASWYDFAVAVQEEAVALGMLSKMIPITPITTEEYPLPAKRPAYSVLEKRQTAAATGIVPTHWRANLRLMLRELHNA